VACGQRDDLGGQVVQHDVLDHDQAAHAVGHELRECLLQVSLASDRVDEDREPERPACSISLTSPREPGFVVFHRTLKREARGTVSFRSSSRFALSSGDSTDIPVTFPPGRDRLETNPALTASATAGKTIGIVCVARFCRESRGRASGHDDVDLEPHELGSKLRKPVRVILVFDGVAVAHCDGMRRA